MVESARHCLTATTVLVGLGLAILPAAASGTDPLARPTAAATVAATAEPASRNPAVKPEFESIVSAAIAPAMPSSGEGPQASNLAFHLASNHGLLPDLPTEAAAIEARNRVFRERVARAVGGHPADHFGDRRGSVGLAFFRNYVCGNLPTL